MIELYLFTLLILGSAYYLWSVYSYAKQEAIKEEDRRIAEVLLPIARLMNKLEGKEVEDLRTDFYSDLSPDEFIMVVRKHAWRNGIKVCRKETELCYRLIRNLPLSEDQEDLLEQVRPLLEQVEDYPEGLVISSEVCDK